MRAVRWHAARDVRVEEVPDAPDPVAGQIRVAVEWCGICGTDVEEYLEGPVVIPVKPHPLTGLAAPQIIGHEVVGRVADVGPGVSRLQPGQLVALDGYITCGECAACRRHEPNLCRIWAQCGMGWPGGLAEAVTVPEAMAFPATAEVAADALALAEPFSVAVRALRRGRFTPGEVVTVLGGGTIGLAVLQVARAMGAAEVRLVEPLPHRRALAESLGARAVASSELLDDEPADLAVECTGHERGAAIVLPLVRAGGRVVLLGVNPAPLSLNLLDVVLREVELIGSVGHVGDEDFATAVDLISHARVDAASLISHRVPLEQAVTDGIAFLAGAGRATAVKILVSPRH